MSSEISAAFNHCFDAMRTDTTLAPLVTNQTGIHIYARQVPTDIWKLTDYYIFGSLLAPGSDFRGGFGVRLMTDPLFLWYVVKKGQADAKLMQIDVAMDNVLTNIRAQLSGGFQFSVVRESPWDRVTRDEANTSYTELGGRYRAYISK